MILIIFGIKKVDCIFCFNPVAPTLKNQVIIESYPDSLFYCLEICILVMG